MNSQGFESTTDFDEASMWGVELSGPANFFTFWIPRERFIRASRSADKKSMSATRVDRENIFGIAVGTEHEISDDWTHFSIDQKADQSKINTSKFKGDGSWRSYAIETKLQAHSSPALTINNNEEIDTFLAANFPDSSVKAGDEEIVMWGGLRDENGKLIALGGLVKWESQQIAAVSIGVDKDLRGQGLGQKIAQALVKSVFDLDYPIMCLGVQEGNIPAIKAYESTGFKLIAAFNHYSLIEENKHLWSRP
jgi:ribosomal protein S18 acetylase RimI-like enzyme